MKVGLDPTQNTAITIVLLTMVMMGVLGGGVGFGSLEVLLRDASSGQVLRPVWGSRGLGYSTFCNCSSRLWNITTHILRLYSTLMLIEGVEGLATGLEEKGLESIKSKSAMHSW